MFDIYIISNICKKFKAIYQKEKCIVYDFILEK